MSTKDNAMKPKRNMDMEDWLTILPTILGSGKTTNQTASVAEFTLTKASKKKKEIGSMEYSNNEKERSKNDYNYIYLYV